MIRLKLVTTRARGKALLADALADETGSSWPEAHFLGPLHPVIDWAADRALASLGRNQVFAVRGAVDHPTFLLLGTLTNRRGHVVASAYLTAEFPNPANPRFCVVTPHESAAAMAAAAGYADTASNPGPVAGADALQPLIAHAIDTASSEMSAVFAAAEDAARTSAACRTGGCCTCAIPTPSKQPGRRNGSVTSSARSAPAPGKPGWPQPGSAPRLQPPNGPAITKPPPGTKRWRSVIRQWSTPTGTASTSSPASWPTGPTGKPPPASSATLP